MRKCYKCGTPWDGRGQPRPRQNCSGCGAYLHSCVNCQQFDHNVTNSCRLQHTDYIGPRMAQNYCEDFRMVSCEERALKVRIERARDAWEQLFRK